MKKPKAPLFSAARISSLAALLTLGVIFANVENPSKSKVQVVEENGVVRVTWPVSDKENGSVVFSMDEAKPLIQSMAVGEKTIATGLNPSTVLTVGSRNMDEAAGWVAFFDNPPKREYKRYSVKLGKRSLKVTEQGAHTTVSVAEASAGNFNGEVRFTFYRNSGLMQAETVLSTEEDGRAIVYDTGLTSAKPDWKNTVWKDTSGNIQRVPLNSDAAATPLEVEGRTIVAEGDGASLAVFPAPHRYFYPLDEAFNLKFVWHGRNYVDLLPDSGLGIRQELNAIWTG
ncbi:MAG: hypothetical protein EOP87_26945 [Verrucomicrobiaceae bacterium]|nr:MAG: hypothetical protein EOP87_26945 [Verrucomicrobiaceae bacterium]